MCPSFAFEKKHFNVWGQQKTSTNLPHAPHHAELLCVDEALQHDPDGHVDVVLQYIVPQVHFGVSLRHADHGLNVTNRDGDAACGLWHQTRVGYFHSHRWIVWWLWETNPEYSTCSHTLFFLSGLTNSVTLPGFQNMFMCKWEIKWEEFFRLTIDSLRRSL